MPPSAADAQDQRAAHRSAQTIKTIEAKESTEDKKLTFGVNQPSRPGAALRPGL